MIYALVFLAVIVTIWIIGTLNGFVRLKQTIHESWANIDVQLKRRHDLIPQLIECAKGYASHENSLFERVSIARERAVSTLAPTTETMKNERDVADALEKLMVRLESYPDLKASAHFLELQRELADTEDRIAAARRFYNSNVKEYNSRLGAFPAGALAGATGHVIAPYFDSDIQ